MIILTFTFFALVCFGGIFFLPDLRELGLGEKSNLERKDHLADAGMDVHHVEDINRLREKIKDQNIIPPPPSVSSIDNKLDTNLKFDKKRLGENSVSSEVDKMRRDKVVQVNTIDFIKLISQQSISLY